MKERIDLRANYEIGTGLAILVQCSLYTHSFEYSLHFINVPENISGKINMTKTSALHSVNSDSKRSNT